MTNHPRSSKADAAVDRPAPDMPTRKRYSAITPHCATSTACLRPTGPHGEPPGAGLATLEDHDAQARHRPLELEVDRTAEELERRFGLVHPDEEHPELGEGVEVSREWTMG